MNRKEWAKEQMQEMVTNGVCYVTFPAFTHTGLVKHAFTTRIGGASEGYLGSMNLSYSRGDKKVNVDENYRRMSEILCCNMDDFVVSDQTHTTNIYKVSDLDKGKGVVREKDYHDIDGLITNEKGIVLTTMFADCVQLFILDPVKKAIGLVHSGWRGTVNKIGKVAIEAMTKEYGTNPADIIAGIGPSICKDCYEVSMDVADAFRMAFQNSGMLEKIVLPKNEEKAMLDLWQANVAVFLEAGVQEENIHVTDLCTCCNPDLFFSHRASNGKRGNLAAFMSLN